MSAWEAWDVVLHSVRDLQAISDVYITHRTFGHSVRPGSVDDQDSLRLFTRAALRLNRSGLRSVRSLQYTSNLLSKVDDYLAGDSAMRTQRRIGEMEGKLGRFAALEQGWDSYGAPPIDVGAIEEAREIWTALIERSLPDPWAAPGGDAGIGFQWDLKRVKFYIDIVPGEPTAYLLTPLNPDGSKYAEAQEKGELNQDNLTEVLGRFAGLV